MDDAPPVKLVEPPRTAPQRRLHPAPIIRDVAIVFALTFFGGVVVRIAAGGPAQDAQQVQLAIAASNLFFGTVGFTIAGCLAPPGRWQHLGMVAIGAWLAGLINVAFFGLSIPLWIGGIIAIAIIMGIGGALSYLFKKDRQPPA